MSEIKPIKWGSYLRQLYVSRKPPTLGTVDVEELQEKAREALKDHKEAFLYVHGSAGTWSTARDNLRAFRRFAIVPRMLIDASSRTLETTIFGVRYPSPVLLAPIGVQGITHPEGELGTARAAGRMGIPFIMSSSSTRSLEDVAQANGSGPRWYQLYWPRTNEITLSLLKRAKDNGFTALVVTLDTMLLGWRPHDLPSSYMPFFHGVGVQVGTSDPVFMARYNLPPRVYDRPKFPYEPSEMDELITKGDEQAKTNAHIGAGWIAECNSGHFQTWEDIAFLKDNWDGPLLLKGILNVKDAEKALEIGVDGIVVSNHGGRQIDGAIPSLFALEAICASPKIEAAQSSGKITVLFDSGIRTGSDILKAMALGAQGVLLGRPFVYGLMIGGEAGVEQVLRQTLADLEITMALSGYRNVGEFQGKRDEVITRVDLP